MRGEAFTASLPRSLSSRWPTVSRRRKRKRSSLPIALTNLRRATKMPLPDITSVLVKHRAGAKASQVMDDFDKAYLAEVRDSVVTAIDDGLTLSDWTASFDAIN